MHIWALLLFINHIRTGASFRITSLAQGTQIINQISAVHGDAGRRVGNVREKNLRGICGRGYQEKECVSNVITIINLITSTQNEYPGTHQQTANPPPDTAISVRWRSTDHQRTETTEHAITGCTNRSSEPDPRNNCRFECPGGTWYMRRTEDVPVCYGFFPSFKVRNMVAETTCGRRGAHLVSIETNEEMQFLKDLILETPELEVKGYYVCASGLALSAFRGYWTCGRKYGRNWIWYATGRPITYFNWRFGQPDGIVGDKFVFMDTGEAKWWDVSQLKEAAPLCEKPAECLANV